MATSAEIGDMRRKTWQLIADLKPFPGRLYLSVTIGAICAISIAICMLYHYPEASIGCYLVIFLMKPNAAENVLTGVGIIVAVSGVVFLLIGIINLTINSPPAQMAAIVTASFIFLYADSATKAGEQAGIVALVISFVLTLLSDIPVGEAATRAVLYAWAMVFVPMAVMVVYNLLFGIPPQTLLRWTMTERLERAAAYLRQPSDENRLALMDALNEGTAEQEKELQLIRLLHLVPGEKYDFLERSQAHSYRVLLAAMTLPEAADTHTRLRLAQACAAMANALRTDQPLPAFDAGEYATPAFAPLAEALDLMARIAPLPTGTPVADPFVAPDIFQNPLHLHFALKTTLAAVTCYVLYTVMDWQGIHTAMITCYVAALGTTGDTVHKLVLRISGCLIGAFMGLLAILLLIPHLESVGGLAFMIFGVVTLAAWVSTGNERISYGGVQIALAFLLTVVQGFGPGISFSSGWDRVVGILLGNAVVYLIFTNIWPVSVSQEVGNRTRSAFQKLLDLAAAEPAQRCASTALVAAVQADLGVIRNAVEMASYEPRHMRPTQDMRQTYHEDADTLNNLAVALYFEPTVHADLQGRLRQAQDRFVHSTPRPSGVHA